MDICPQTPTLWCISPSWIIRLVRFPDWETRADECQPSHGGTTSLHLMTSMFNSLLILQLGCKPAPSHMSVSPKVYAMPDTSAPTVFANTVLVSWEAGQVPTLQTIGVPDQPRKKRAHCKSRRGCLACKRRRVKVRSMLLPCTSNGCLFQSNNIEPSVTNVSHAPAVSSGISNACSLCTNMTFSRASPRPGLALR